MDRSRNHRRPLGFTLIELLVVVVIIGLVSIATLPTIIPAYQHRQASEGARMLQAAIVGAHDQAIRANEPRGIRLLADPIFPGPNSSGDPNAPLAFNRWVPIEPANDHTEGFISLGTPFNNNVAFMQSAYAAVDPTIVPASNFFQMLSSITPYTVTPTNTLTYPYNNGGRSPFPFGRIGVQQTTHTFDGASGVWLPNPPTNWFWNIRQGDQIRFDNSGRTYTIAGPMLQGVADGSGIIVNPERFINFGPPGTNNAPREFLFLVNGQDDDGDGIIDEGFDGIDNDGDGVTDPGFNGLDDDGDGLVDEVDELFYAATGFAAGGEYEPEQFVGSQFSPVMNLSDDPADIDSIGIVDEPQEWFFNKRYTITRRPVVTPGSRETVLPSGVVIDATTWNSGTIPTQTGNGVVLPAPLPERSRLPIDPYTQTADIMISPGGQVGSGGAGLSTMTANPTAATMNVPFYHFWIAERDDVFPTLNAVLGRKGNTTNGASYAILAPNPRYTTAILATGAANLRPYLLPMPEGTPFYEDGTPALLAPNTFLKGQRRLVTLFTRNGMTVTTEDVQFMGNDTNYPYYAAQAGVREAR